MQGRRALLIAAALGAVAAAALVLLIGLPIALTHRQDLPLERAYADVVVSLVARLGAGSAANPLAGDRKALVTGREAFVGSCAVCHGAKGDGRGAFGLDTYPPATDLTRETSKQKSDAELFWITKNGLSFTAMPAFGAVYKDEDLWSLVTYIRAVQQGTGGSINVPKPTSSQILLADPAGDAVARGAAVYFAQGCHLCHGAEGEAPGDLSIVGRVQTEVVRRGTRGMPAYGTDRISSAELADLEKYLVRFASVGSAD